MKCACFYIISITVCIESVPCSGLCDRNNRLVKVIVKRYIFLQHRTRALEHECKRTKKILDTTTTLLSVIDSLNGNRAKCQEKHAHFLFVFEGT